MTAALRGAAFPAVRLRRVDPAQDADLEAIARVAWATWPPTYEDILPMRAVHEHLRAAYAPQALRGRLALDGGLFLLAEAGLEGGPGLPVGYCQVAIRVAAPADADLWAIYVHPAWQGRGIGRRLLEAAAASVPDCRLHVALAAENRGAAAFYKVLGFVPEGNGYSAGIQGAAVTMRTMVRGRRT